MNRSTLVMHPILAAMAVALCSCGDGYDPVEVYPNDPVEGDPNGRGYWEDPRPQADAPSDGRLLHPSDVLYRCSQRFFHR